jgi:hypothetical protein
MNLRAAGKRGRNLLRKHAFTHVSARQFGLTANHANEFYGVASKNFVDFNLVESPVRFVGRRIRLAAEIPSAWRARSPGTPADYRRSKRYAF